MKIGKNFKFLALALVLSASFSVPTYAAGADVPAKVTEYDFAGKDNVEYGITKVNGGPGVVATGYQYYSIDGSKWIPLADGGNIDLSTVTAATKLYFSNSPTDKLSGDFKNGHIYIPAPAAAPVVDPTKAGTVIDSVLFDIAANTVTVVPKDDKGGIYQAKVGYNSTWAPMTTPGGLLIKNYNPIIGVTVSIRLAATADNLPGKAAVLTIKGLSAAPSFSIDAVNGTVKGMKVATGTNPAIKKQVAIVIAKTTTTTALTPSEVGGVTWADTTGASIDMNAVPLTNLAGDGTDKSDLTNTLSVGNAFVAVRFAEVAATATTTTIPASQVKLVKGAVIANQTAPASSNDDYTFSTTSSTITATAPMEYTLDDGVKWVAFKYNTTTKVYVADIYAEAKKLTDATTKGIKLRFAPMTGGSSATKTTTPASVKTGEIMKITRPYDIAADPLKSSLKSDKFKFNGLDGTINVGVGYKDNVVEYCITSGSAVPATWTKFDGGGTGDAVTEADTFTVTPQTYDQKINFRVATSGSAALYKFASATTTITVKKPANAPTAGVLDYATEMITGLGNKTLEVTTNGSVFVTGGTDGKLDISSWIGAAASSYNVRVAATATAFASPTAAAVTIPARPVAPVNVTITTSGEATTFKVTTAGKYQYRKASDTTGAWSDIDATTAGKPITKIAIGETYSVRLKAVTSGTKAFASESASVEVKAN